MRQNLLVFVPQEGGKSSSVSYSMYACGVKKEKPEFSADGKFLYFKFDGNCVAVLFYYFSGFKRAYVVTGWDASASETKSALPGVEGDLFVLFAATGRDFRSLEYVIHFLTKYNEEMAFKLPLSFWFRLCALIQGRNAKRSSVLHLLHTTKEALDFYGRQNDTRAEVSA